MANPVPVQLTVDPEVKALGDFLKVLVGDIKAKKTVMEDVMDAYTSLKDQIGALGDITTDYKRVDNQAYILKCLGDALEG